MNVLVVDDSILFRRVMAQALASLPDVTVVGQAANGRIALQKVRDLKPDLITLDMEMPEMDGMAVLNALRETDTPPAVMVVSALTRQGGNLTMKALQKGAFDFITKPDSTGAEESLANLKAELAPRIRALSLRLGVRGILRGGRAALSPKAVETAPLPKSAVPTGEIARRMARLTGAKRPEMVLIGVSTGGPNALAILLPMLPGKLGVPLFIVQHMPPLFTQSLAENLAGKCALSVREAAHGESANPDTIYIAPGGKQMRLAPGSDNRPEIQITDDPPENNCRPAVDYLFRSAANHFPGRALAVILTGMGSDGTLGLRLLKRHHCIALAQDEASCVVYGMPKSAVDAGVVDEVLPLDIMAARITSVVHGGSG